MIFPQLGPQYYNERDKPILSRMEAFYAESITINQSFWGESDTDTRFLVGDQTMWNDLYGNLPANRRRQFNFNRIRRVVEMISGHQRRNRKSIIAVPKENGDAQTADQFTKILLWACNQEGILETVSEAFYGALTVGMNLLQVWVDYRSDPVSGNIRVDNTSYNGFLIDPYFRKNDLSDCNGIWKRSYLTRREIVSLLPEHTEEILGLMGNETGTRDGKFQYAPESYGFNYNKLLTYDEYYYRDYRTQKMLVDTQTGESTEWTSNDEEKLRLFLQTYPTITVIDQEIPTVKLAIVVQGKVMYHGPNPMGIDKYPFVPVLGYYTPQSPYFPWRIQGVVRGLRDAQYLYNRRRIIELDILESQINAGWKYKEDALVNPRDVFLEGQGRGLALKKEAQMTDVERILPPDIPPSMIQLSELLANEIQEISGVSEELLGSATDDKAGILSMLRQGAGLTTLQSLFDNLDHAQKLLGGILIDLVQTNFTPGKIKKILEGQEPSPQFYNKAFGKYNAAVEDGLNTATQKQMQFAQLMYLREAGVPVPDSILIDAATIQNKQQLLDALSQQQQIQQAQQQQQAQLAQAQADATVEVARARAAADQGLGMERMSRVQENAAASEERLAAALKEEDLALLNLVKALKELESMDVAHINQLVTLAQAIKKSEQSAEAISTMQSAPETGASAAVPGSS